MASLGCGPRLGDIVGSFKAAVTRLARAELGWCGAPLWQRGFYEHVVRDEADLDRARHYIQDNPLRWLLDRENPGRDR
ncbi:MAG: hypothetical protein M0Z94_13785 [Dehalococcoidales bacterium]|nr:hypothetical protein [Dehalococcoidales bacterium]